ncbi:hypothetical protein ACJJTC_009603 [Scirpophaga incertulas]
MSTDIYFCFCCLSTTDLSCLYDNNKDTNYGSLLQDLFHINICVEDYEYDSHICGQCSKIITEFLNFKANIMEILNILQSNGLIALIKSKETVNVKKVIQASDLEIEDKCVNEECIKKFDACQSTDEGSSIKKEKDYKLVVRPEEINIKVLKQESTSKTELQDNVTQYQVTDDLKCTVCAKLLPNLYMYHVHMNQHYPNHICDTCGKGFLTEQRLKRHMPSHKLGPFRCTVCGIQFSNSNSLNSHRQRKHNSVPLYRCPQCEQRFATITRRANHLAAVHRVTDAHYQCSMCPRKFLVSSNLRSHIRKTHLKEKRHTCQHCSATFHGRQDLVAHTATHTGQYAHHCHVCPKRYTRRKALIVHLRTHTDDRRFSCEVCGKRFIQKCSLLRHGKVHSQKVIESEVPQHGNVEHEFLFET